MNFKILIYYTLCFLFVKSAISQDGHYWTNQFGPKSSLLGGSMMGNVRDNSAAYYNASGLALTDSLAGVSIQVSSYGIERVEFKNGAGTGKDLKSSNFIIAPIVVTGKLGFKKINKIRFGYFLAERNKSSYKTSARTDGFFNVVNDVVSPGNEEYISQLDVTLSFREINAGFGIGYKINDTYAIGLTNYGAYRKSLLTSTHISRAILNDGVTITSYDKIQNIDFTNLRTVIKLAAMADYGKFKIGLTVTAPSINLWGNGNISIDYTYNNIYIGDNLTPYNFVADDKQIIKKTTYKTPLSVALGVTYAAPKTALHLTTEYFAPLKTYTLLQPEPRDFIRPSNLNFEIKSSDFLRIREGKRSVVNAAIGIEHKVSSKTAVLASLRTDFFSTTISKEDLVKITRAYWNLYHFNAGISYRRTKSSFLVGILASYGKTNNLPQIVNISNPTYNSDYPLQGNIENNVIATYTAFQLMFGYVYYIK